MKKKQFKPDILNLQMLESIGQVILQNQALKCIAQNHMNQVCCEYQALGKDESRMIIGKTSFPLEWGSAGLLALNPKNEQVGFR